MLSFLHKREKKKHKKSLLLHLLTKSKSSSNAWAISRYLGFISDLPTTRVSIPLSGFSGWEKETQKHNTRRIFCSALTERRLALGGVCIEINSLFLRKMLVSL